jgi:hypothetical protein
MAPILITHSLAIILDKCVHVVVSIAVHVLTLILQYAGGCVA